MGTVTKALSLLSFFNRSRSTIGLSEMARLSGLNKATVHRLLTEMQAQGFVEQTGAGREYRLGPAFLRLAALREAAVPTRDLAQAVLADLSQATGETAHVSMLHGDTLVTVAYAYSPQHGTRVTMEDAEVLTFHNTSSGLATLAFSEAGFVDEILSRPLEKRTPHTETDPGKIRATLSDVRTSGMAQNIGGFEDDVHSHAMPLFDAQSHVIGAIAVAAPTARMSRNHQALIQRELRHHALRLTRLMGGFLPDGFQREEAA
ncbi:IclR family transcriptional regulator [Marimonas lutisalis]|uniref:IclR family transcriptional regulator n=1 Tax=Marimonas lutisalis TaxID=2545756 RepID=UPI0010F697D8|nr:IclR family transcriptional regulator [Marimonas lutisalis]